MSNVNEKAVETLLRLRLELIQGIATAGEQGGAGMSQRLAPILVQIQQAIEIIEKLSTEEAGATVAERMAAMRAKRNSK